MRVHWIIGAFTCLVALAGASDARAQQGSGIAFINSQRIIEQAPGAQEARETLEAEMQQYRTELQQLEQELQAKIQDYQQQVGTMTEEARAAREQEIREQRQQLQQRATELDQQAAQRQQQLVEPIMQQIEDVIEALRVERNYAMIFDSAPGTSLIAADPSLDITDDVIQRLRQTAQSSQQ
ncbi:MAG: OmpH family outer membrane protein [Longimicrobiales bacterium]